MAWLRKFVDRSTYLLILGVWNATSTYVTIHFNFSVETIVFIVTVGNLIIGWIGVESGQTEAKK